MISNGKRLGIIVMAASITPLMFYGVRRSHPANQQALGQNSTARPAISDHELKLRKFIESPSAPPIENTQAEQIRPQFNIDSKLHDFSAQELMAASKNKEIKIKIAVQPERRLVTLPKIGTVVEIKYSDGQTLYEPNDEVFQP